MLEGADVLLVLKVFWDDSLVSDCIKSVLEDINLSVTEPAVWSVSIWQLADVNDCAESCSFVGCDAVELGELGWWLWETGEIEDVGLSTLV